MVVILFRSQCVNKVCKSGSTLRDYNIIIKIYQRGNRLTNQARFTVAGFQLHSNSAPRFNIKTFQLSDYQYKDQTVVPPFYLFEWESLCYSEYFFILSNPQFEWCHFIQMYASMTRSVYVYIFLFTSHFMIKHRKGKIKGKHTCESM